MNPACPGKAADAAGEAAGPNATTASKPIAATASGMPTASRWNVTRKLTSVHAMPSKPATNRPTFSERFSTIRRTRPTVAETRAHPAITARRADAARNPSATVGSPPPMRIVAHATMAQLKKITTK